MIFFLSMCVCIFIVDPSAGWLAGWLITNNRLDLIGLYSVNVYIYNFAIVLTHKYTCMCIQCSEFLLT